MSRLYVSIGTHTAGTAKEIVYSHVLSEIGSQDKSIVNYGWRALTPV